MKRKALGVMKLLVSVALFSYLLSIVNFDKTLARLQTIDFRYLGLALVFLVGQVAISAAKWWLILRSDGIRTPYLLLLKSYYIGNFFSLFLPSSFGGDVYRVLAVTSSNQKLGKTTSSVLFDRLTGLFALLSIAVIAYVSLPGQKYDVIALICYGFGVVCFWFSTTNYIIIPLQKSAFSIVRKIAVLFRSFQTYRRDLASLWMIMAIAFVFQFMIVAINKLYATALDIDITFAHLLVIVPLVYLTEVIPFSINGIGIRDSAFVFFFVLAGHTKEEGLAIALLVLAMRYVSGLIGGNVLLASVVRNNFLGKTTADN